MTTDLIARFRQRLNSLCEWQPNALPRPAQMLLTVAATLAAGLLADLLAGSPVWHRLFYPAQNIPADVQAWSALIYALLLIGGLPVAFLIWHWRDVNVRDQIENARKDINLKEFQEVQLRAAGALDEKLPLEAREQLQIAALHQLRTFLRGDYGDSFKRPAFELLLAGHAAAVERIGVPSFRDVFYRDDWKDKIPTADFPQVSYINSLNPVDIQRMEIIRHEAITIFQSGFPLYGRRLDLLHLSNLDFGADTLIIGSSFFGCNFHNSTFCSSTINQNSFIFAACYRTKFIDCKLWESRFDEATFVDVNLCGSDIHGIDPSLIKDTDSNTCIFYDDATIFSGTEPWRLKMESGDEVRDAWRAIGARHVNELINK